MPVFRAGIIEKQDNVNNELIFFMNVLHTAISFFFHRITNSLLFFLKRRHVFSDPLIKLMLLGKPLL